MRSKENKALVHDLLHLRDYWNPLLNGYFPIFIDKKITLNLLTGKVIPSRDDDSIEKFLKEKTKWFKEFVKKRDGNLKDFDKAVIELFGKKEKVIIIYKGKEYSIERVC